MASFPGANVHRPSRRKLGKGQHTQLAPVTISLTTATPDVTITYSQPVIVRGTPGLVVTGLTIVSFQVLSSTQVKLVMSGAIATQAWTYPSNDPNVNGANGGQTVAASGTF